MPSIQHEALVSLFRNRPVLAAELLHDVLGVELPAYREARIESEKISEILPAEYRADLVVLLVDGKPVFAIVVEVQLSRDERKRFTWPVYATSLRARFECECIVLVVTPERSVAEWAAQSVRIGGASVFAPLVIGPDGTPVVTDPGVPPELAVLSVLAHGGGDVDTAVRLAMAAGRAIGTVPDADQRTMYYDLVVAALSEAARKAFAMLPQGYQWQSEIGRTSAAKGRAEGRVEGKAEGRVEGKAEGRVEGKAEAVLDILEARGLAVSDAHRARILSCTDLDLLRHWTRRAAKVAMSAELFED